MLLRTIFSRIHKHKHFATLCSIENVEPSPVVSPQSPSSKKCVDKGYVVSYLVRQCGLSEETAISVSKGVHFHRSDRPNAVLNFLEEKGFSKSQIAQLVTGKPNVLVSNPEKTLLRRFEFYVKLFGFEADTLKALSRYPFYLGKSLEKTVGPVYEYLKDTIGVERGRTLWRRGSWVYNIDPESSLIPNVEFLRVLGVPQSCIRLGLVHFSELFVLKPDEFKATVEEVRRMGFDPMKTTFIVALHARAGKGSQALWDKCYETYVRWGWTEDDINKAFRKHPGCMLLSEGKVSRALDFVVNEVGRNARLVADCPYILFYSLEKRIIPRCSVVHTLVSMDLLKKDWSFTSVLCPKEKDFLDRYVKTYQDKVPHLLHVYNGQATSVDA